MQKKFGTVATKVRNLATIDMGQKEGGGCAPFGGCGLLPYQVASSPIQSFTATIDMGRKLQGSTEAPAFFWGGGGELDPHLTQCRLGRGLPPHQVTS